MRASSALPLAWRNLGRNRRRTLLALAAIAGAQCVVLVYDGLLRGERDWALESITGPFIGHAQIHAPGWRDDRAVDRFVQGGSALLAHLRRRPEVARATARVYAPALAAVREEGHPVLLVGVDPAGETGEGGLLAGVAPDRYPGPARAVIGWQLAEAMEVREGDQLAVLGQGADGSVAQGLYEVVALARGTVDAINRTGVLLAIDDAQELLGMPDGVHEIVLRAPDLEASEAMVASLAADPALSGLDLAHWIEIAPAMANILGIIDAAAWVILVVLFLAAAAGVANTLLMSVFERTRELGMLLALGARPRRLVGMVVAEATLLGIAGVLVGSAVGIAAVLVLSRTGVDLTALAPQREAASQLSFGGLTWSMKFYPRIDPGAAIRSVAAVVMTAALAGLWPAARVARLEPTEALRS